MIRAAQVRCPQAIFGDGACSGRAEPTAFRGFGSACCGSWRRQFDVGDFRLGTVHDLSRTVRYSRQSIGSAWANPQAGRWAQEENRRGSNPCSRSQEPGCASHPRRPDAPPIVDEPQLAQPCDRAGEEGAQCLAHRGWQPSTRHGLLLAGQQQDARRRPAHRSQRAI
jgi:hypothetical protein